MSATVFLHILLMDSALGHQHTTSPQQVTDGVGRNLQDAVTTDFTFTPIEADWWLSSSGGCEGAPMATDVWSSYDAEKNCFDITSLGGMQLSIKIACTGKEYNEVVYTHFSGAGCGVEQEVLDWPELSNFTQSGCSGIPTAAPLGYRYYKSGIVDANRQLFEYVAPCLKCLDASDPAQQETCDSVVVIVPMGGDETAAENTAGAGGDSENDDDDDVVTTPVVVVQGGEEKQDDEADANTADIIEGDESCLDNSFLHDFTFTPMEAAWWYKDNEGCSGEPVGKDVWDSWNGKTNSQNCFNLIAFGNVKVSSRLGCRGKEFTDFYTTNFPGFGCDGSIPDLVETSQWDEFKNWTVGDCSGVPQSPPIHYRYYKDALGMAANRELLEYIAPCLICMNATDPDPVQKEICDCVEVTTPPEATSIFIWLVPSIAGVLALFCYVCVLGCPGPWNKDESKSPSADRLTRITEYPTLNDFEAEMTKIDIEIPEDEDGIGVDPRLRMSALEHDKAL